MVEPVTEVEAQPAAPAVVAVEPPPRTWRRWLRWSHWRELFTGNLSPRSIGLATGVGAAIGVAPLPGFQTMAVGLLCWRLRLNFPVALIASNISLGPLLVMWAAVSASLGRWLHRGVLPWHSYASFLDDFRRAGTGWDGLLSAVGACVVDWLLGSLVLVPAVGLIVGFGGFSVAYAVRAVRGRGRAAT